MHEWNGRIKKVYRPNVVGVIFNDDGEVLIQKSRRFHNHWQFPQGGADEGESLDSAIVREVEEELEIGADKLKVIKKVPETHRYVAPRYGQLLQGYKGQEQNIFLLKYTGGHKTFSYQNNDEVSEAKFFKKDEVAKILHKDRLPVWEIAKKYF